VKRDLVYLAATERRPRFLAGETGKGAPGNGKREEKRGKKKGTSNPSEGRNPIHRKQQMTEPRGEKKSALKKGKGARANPSEGRKKVKEKRRALPTRAGGGRSPSRGESAAFCPVLRNAGRGKPISIPLEKEKFWNQLLQKAKGGRGRKGKGTFHSAKRVEVSEFHRRIKQEKKGPAEGKIL